MLNPVYPKAYSVLAIALLLAAILTPDIAWPQGFSAEPEAACDFMREDGLRTRGGYRANGSVYECRSRRRNLISGGRLVNTIRFLARGDANKVTQLNLELQVNSGTAIQRAHRNLAEHAATLFETALREPLPADIETAILSGVRGSWDVSGKSVTLQRIVLSGPGYELRLRIE